MLLNLQLYLKKKNWNETAIEAIPFKCISPKSPDASFKDYCALEFFKRAHFKLHSKTFCGLSKIMKEEWNKINLGVLSLCLIKFLSLLCWKFRCNMRVQQRGYEINILENLIIFPVSVYFCKIVTKMRNTLCAY